MMRAGLALAALSLAMIPVGCEQGADATEITALRNENRALKASLDALSEKVDGIAGKAAPAVESAGARPIDAAKMKSEIRSEIFEEMNLKLAALQNVAAPTATTVDAASSEGVKAPPPEVKAVLDSYMQENFAQLYEAKAAADEAARRERQREQRRVQTLAGIDRQLDRIAENTPMSAVDREKVKTIYAELTEKSSALWESAREGMEGGNVDWQALRTQGEELRKTAEATLKSSVTPEIYTAVTESGLGRTGGGMGMARGPGGAFGGGEAPAPGRDAQPRNNNQPRRGGGDANPAQPSEGGGEQPAPRRRNRDNGNGGNNNQ